jgi:hypothetical protein
MRILATVLLVLAAFFSVAGQRRGGTGVKTGKSAQPVEAYFMFTDGKDTFVLKLTDPKKIREARDILSGKEKKKTHVYGLVAKKPEDYNKPWHFHLVPDSITFFEMAIEVCDSSISYVEEHLDEVGGSFLPGRRWCPWASKLVKEVSSALVSELPSSLSQSNNQIGDSVAPQKHPSNENNALQNGTTAQATKLTGGFIQLGNDEARLPHSKWADLLNEMKGGLGMDTMFVQNLFSEDSDGKHSNIHLSHGRIDVNRPQYDPGMTLSDDDPTEAILKYADDHGLEVYLGLWLEELKYGTASGSSAGLENFLNKATEKSIAAAELAWNLYHAHPSFKGWYIAYELWNFPFGDQSPESKKKQELLRLFLSRVVDKCKGLNARKEADGMGRERGVAVSAYFNPWFDQAAAGPPVTGIVYTSILTGSGVDTLILQDSVAAKCLGSERLDDAVKENMREQIKSTILPEYLRAFYDAAKAASNTSHTIHLWDDVEAYETVSARCPTPHEFDKPEASLPFRPSNIERLKWQFSVATVDPMTNEPYVDLETSQPIQFFEKFVVFDTFHYINTVIPEGFGTAPANTQQMRTKLFIDYKKEFVERTFHPNFPARGEHNRR